MSDFVQNLAKVSDLWLDPRQVLRQETIQALQVSTGFSSRQIEMAISNCFEELNNSSFPAVIGRESMDPRQRHSGMTSKSVLHILPSNAFTAWVHGATINLLLGHRCLLKPSSREPVFARAWRKSLERVDPSLAKRVDIVAWTENILRDVGAVVAYGSDETLQTIRSQLPAGMPFAGYGHKLSVGIIFREALEINALDSLLERVRQDVEPFRLQGCLSPQILYVEDPRFTRWPELEAVVDVSPKIRTFTRWEDVLQELKKFSPYLSGVGFAGEPERETFVMSELRDAGVSRISPLGRMQKPPLTWRNGGIFLPDLLN